MIDKGQYDIISLNFPLSNQIREIIPQPLVIFQAYCSLFHGLEMNKAVSTENGDIPRQGRIQTKREPESEVGFMNQLGHGIAKKQNQTMGSSQQ